MEFSIPNSTFVRLNNVAMQPDEHDEFDRPFFKAIRIEFRKGKKYAIASNSHTFAVEYLGTSVAEDGFVNISNRADLVAQLRTELQFMPDASMSVGYNGGWALATTAMGKMIPENLAIPGGEWIDWRKKIPTELPKKSTGAPVFNWRDIVRLGQSSPSGELILPKTIDASAPIFFRDLENPNWLGVYLRRDASTGKAFPPAELPDWL